MRFRINDATRIYKKYKLYLFRPKCAKTTNLCSNGGELPNRPYVGRSPGLVVMGGDSCCKGHEFESWQHILDGHFFTYVFLVTFVMCVWKDENKWKRGWGWPIFLKKDCQSEKLGQGAIKLKEIKACIGPWSKCMACLTIELTTLFISDN